MVGTASEERGRIVAERLAAERSLTVIPPFDDDRIIAGQGTIGLELLEDLPDLAAVLVPVGGGGLASGIATAVKALRPSARVVGVEPEVSADARDSLAAGEIVEVASSRRVADRDDRDAGPAIRPDLEHLRAHLDAIVTVSEAEIAAGVRLAAEQSRLVAEPSGALSIAALAFRAEEAGVTGLDGPVVAVVSGGNVDPVRYLEFLAAPIPEGDRGLGRPVVGGAPMAARLFPAIRPPVVRQGQGEAQGHIGGMRSALRGGDGGRSSVIGVSGRVYPEWRITRVLHGVRLGVLRPRPRRGCGAVAARTGRRTDRCWRRRSPGR